MKRARTKEFLKNNYQKKVLIISNDVVDTNMAGPAVRCWEFSKALCHHHKVVLAIPNETGLHSEDFRIVTYDQPEYEILRGLVKDADAIVVQGSTLHLFPHLTAVPKPIVVDLYDPYMLENIEIHSGKALNERLNFHGMDYITIIEQLNEGDFFVCASEKQRDFWIGMLMAIGRTNPLIYDEDKTMRKLIDVVPFGISSSPPRHTRSVLKGVHKSIKKDDKVILWGGGIWEWLDPIILIESIYDIVRQREDVKLFFMGTKHPNPSIPEMTMTARAINLSKKLGLYDQFIFFNDWVPYEDRQNYLLEADVGISTHMNYIESRFSFRTRILDYIWAGIPIIATVGDSMSEIIERYNLGKLVDFQNRDQLTKAILEIIDNTKIVETYKDNLKRISHEFTWENLIQPLHQFFQAPKKTVDRKFRKNFFILQFFESKETHISNLEKINKEKDGHIKNLQESNKEMDRHIKNLQESNRDLQQSIREIRESLPYRVYSKLGTFKKIFR